MDKIVKASALAENGLAKDLDDYYRNRKPNPEMKDLSGYIIKGVDVGKKRMKDIYPDYPLIDLTTTKIEQEDLDFGGYRVRRFYPHDLDDASPSIVFFHGGSFMGGYIENYNCIHRKLAELIHGNVFHVDYSLSPEAAYPTALIQCYHTVEYIARNHEQFKVDTDKLAVYGNSAGGYLVASACLLDRENHYIKQAFMMYPVVDMTEYSLSKFDYSFYGEDLDEFVKGKIKSLLNYRSILDIYLQNNEDPKDELLSPLLSDNLKDFPYTIIMSSEFDVTRMQSEEFRDKLRSAGVKTDYYLFEGTTHGFLDKLGILESSLKSLEIISETIKGQL